MLIKVLIKDVIVGGIMFMAIRETIKSYMYFYIHGKHVPVFDKHQSLLDNVNC